MKKQDTLVQIIADISAEVYRIRRWKEDVGEDPDSKPEKWFTEIIDRLNKFNI